MCSYVVIFVILSVCPIMVPAFPPSVVSALHYIIMSAFRQWKTPESGIPPSYRATRRYTKVHLGFCLRFSTLIGQLGRVPLFRRWTQAVHQVAAIHVGRHRFLACPYRLLAAKRQAKAKIFPRAISTTELPSNPSPRTFPNNQIKILQTSSTHATMAANV